MKKIILFALTFILFNCKKDIKEQDIYKLYNNCYSEKVRVNGKPINYFIKKLKNNYLKDSTSKSYIEFMHQMDRYDFVIIKSNYSFIDSTRNCFYIIKVNIGLST